MHMGEASFFPLGAAEGKQKWHGAREKPKAPRRRKRRGDGFREGVKRISAFWWSQEAAAGSFLTKSWQTNSVQNPSFIYIYTQFVGAQC